MKVQQVSSKIIDTIIVNWPVKAICIVIALLLYFFYNISQLEQKTISVPLKVQSNGQLMAVSSFQKHVRVTVRTNPEKLALINSRDISAVLNLDPFSEPGEVEVPVSLDFASDIFLIEPLEVRVTPDRVRLQLEEKTFAYKNIQVSFADEVPFGYELVSYSVNPPSLKVTGASSAVEQTSRLYTNRLPLSNHTKSFSAPVQISSLNSLVSIENNGEVIVSVEIQPRQIEKQFKNVPVSFVYLKPNLKIVKKSLSSDNITLSFSGDQIILEKMSGETLSVQVDCSKIETPGEYEMELNFLVPANTRLIEKSVEKVKFSVEEISGEKPVAAVAVS